MKGREGERHLDILLPRPAIKLDLFLWQTIGNTDFHNLGPLGDKLVILTSPKQKKFDDISTL